MSPDPALTLDGRQLAIWEQTVATAGMRGLDPPASYGFQQGIAPALPDGSYVVAPQSFFAQGAVGDDAVWVRNALVQASQFSGGFQGAVVRLMATTYTFNTTMVGNEYHTIIPAGIGATIVKLGATSIPAFQWTNRNPAVYDVKATGGIYEPGLTVNGPGGAVNPTDGSIAAQMADIVRLHCRIQSVNCQFGLLSSNQNFQTEQAEFLVESHGCTNPAVFQTAASGGAGRNGSFDRCKVTVYHDETLPGHGLGGIQLLAGAQFTGGQITQYGNWTGTGQAGVYSLYATGTAAPLGASGMKDVLWLTSVEYDGTGTAPNPVFLDTNTFVQLGSGNLRFDSFGATSVVTTAGNWQFAGPISGGGGVVAASYGVINSGFPAGWSGNIYYKRGDSGDTQVTAIEMTIANTTVVTAGETIVGVLPAAFPLPPVTKQVYAVVNGGGLTGFQLAPAAITSGGALIYNGPAFTASSTAGWNGGQTIPVAV